MEARGAVGTRRLAPEAGGWADGQAGGLTGAGAAHPSARPYWRS